MAERLQVWLRMECSKAHARIKKHPRTISTCRKLQWEPALLVTSPEKLHNKKARLNKLLSMPSFIGCPSACARPACGSPRLLIVGSTA